MISRQITRDYCTYTAHDIARQVPDPFAYGTYGIASALHSPSQQKTSCNRLCAPRLEQYLNRSTAEYPVFAPAGLGSRRKAVTNSTNLSSVRFCSTKLIRSISTSKPVKLRISAKRTDSSTQTSLGELKTLCTKARSSRIPGSNNTFLTTDNKKFGTRDTSSSYAAKSSVKFSSVLKLAIKACTLSSDRT